MRTYELYWVDHQSGDDLFPDGLDRDSSLFFHGTASSREDMIDRIGLLPHAAGIAVEQVRLLVECFDLLGWVGLSTTGFIVLQAYTLPNDFRDGERSPIYLSDRPSQAIHFAKPATAGGEKVSACRLAIADLRRLLTDADFREGEKANPDKWIRPDAAGLSDSLLDEVAVRLSRLVDIERVAKWGFVNELIDRPVRFGSSFSKPAKKVVRKAKRESGSRLFEAEDIRQLIAEARQPLKAMIFLGINCAFGQSDIANLALSAINLKTAMINYPRPKNELPRQCSLWPETVKAVREAIALRREAKDEADAGLAFLTHHGAKWIRDGKKEGSEKPFFNDYIGSEFNKLARELKVKRRGGFYNLRHTFRTVADASKDQPAIDMIMGHTSGTMAEEYRDGIAAERLRAVTECVRKWLFSGKKGKHKRTTSS